jgi:PAS domain S-box-containing protein
MESMNEDPGLVFKINSIFDSAHNGVVIINREGRIIVYNKAAKVKLKLQSDEIIGSFIGDVISMEVWSDMQHILNTGIPQIGKKIRLEGSTIIANRTPVMINGKIEGVMSIFQDISEYERVITELETYKRINKELDAIIESSYDGLYITDGNADTLRVNKAYERISGLNRENLLGRNMRELVNMGFISQSVSLEVLKLREPVTIMQEIFGKTGKKKVIVTGNPIFDEDNQNILLVVTNVRDITELEELREELEHRRYLSERYLSELTELRGDLFPEEGIVARSEKMRDIIAMAVKVAQVDASILITGESGVGKSKLARLIHRASKRQDKPFIKINCGAIPEALIESEMFGYERGAFTGARSEGKPGLFEIAHTGTIILDEIGELPLHLQTKLLGILEDRELIRVGGTKSRKVDVRVIAATNSDLKKQVMEKRFRQDLFFRLEVIPINIPPLREHRDDILPLIQHFLADFNKSYETKKRFSPEAIDCLINYDYPGNIRELENIVERLVVVGDQDLILLEHIPRYMIERTLYPAADNSLNLANSNLTNSLSNYEATLIENIINKYGTTYKAAKILGVNQSTVVRKMKKYGIAKAKML